VSNQTKFEGKKRRERKKVKEVIIFCLFGRDLILEISSFCGILKIGLLG
jgi:hypothetical protein